MRRYHILDTPAERIFDDIVVMVSRLCEAPISAISFIDDGREWLKARIGIRSQELALEAGFSRETLRHSGVFEVPDSHADRRFGPNPLGRDEPDIRFYAGVPILSPEGEALGVLSVMDEKPREMEREQRRVLEQYSREITALLETRRYTNASDEESQLRMSSFTDPNDAAKDAFFQSIFDGISSHVAVLDHKGVITLVNRAWRLLADRRGLKSPNHAVGMNYLDVCEADGGPDREIALTVKRYIEDVIRHPEASHSIEYPAHSADEQRWCVARITGFRFSGWVYVVTAHDDVSVWKKTEQALRESEAKLRAVSETVHCGILMHSGEDVLYANRGVEEITGYAREEVARMKLAELLVPEHRREVVEREAARQRGEAAPERYEAKIHTKTGDERCLDVAVSHLQFEGRAASLMAALDVTERTRASEALRESEARLRLVLSQVPAIFWVADRDLRVENLYRVQRVFPTLNLDGQTLYQIFETQDRTLPAIAAHLGALEGKSGEYEVEFMGRHMAAAVEPLRESSGEITGVIGVAVDITQRVLDRDALHRANEALKAVIEASPLAIFWVDHEGIARSWNSAAERIFGWHADEVVGRPLPMQSEKQMAAYRQLLDFQAAGRAITGLERKWMRKDGTPVDIAVWTAPLRDSEGETSGTIVMIADITERRRLEERYVQAQKMEAVGRLAGGVAHDFNNLLTVIVGYTQLVLDKLDPADAIRPSLTEVVKSANRAASLVSQLLSFGRRQVLQPAVINLNDLLIGMGDVTRSLAGETVEVTMELAPDLRAVRVDASKMEQVILNMVMNARDAIEKGGRIVIRTENRTLSEEFADRYLYLRPGRYVALSICDTGHGMDRETMRHIFEPFFTTKRPGKGTGLGLSTSYGIVKQSRGEILVHSEPGRGSTFEVLLPAARNQAPQPAPPARPRTRNARETVLVVEDEPTLRRLIRDTLTVEGYQVLEAENGQEALGVSKSHPGPIHVLLTDVVMPQMGGLEVANLLTAGRPELKVVFTSGYADEVLIRSADTAEKVHFLPKPFSREDLCNMLAALLEQQEE